MVQEFHYDKTNISEHYDTARALPPAAYQAWAGVISGCLPRARIQKICDLGCGTGRFSLLLSELFSARVIGVDPSIKMLATAKRNITSPHIRLALGSAEAIPLMAGSVDVVFMSMCYHHIKNKRQAMAELKRVLRRPGFVVLRNSTRQSLSTYSWLKFFPAAFEIEAGRIPDRDILVDFFLANGFSLKTQEIVSQLFAQDYREYFSKISSRGISSLKAISDQEFYDGCERFERYCNKLPSDKKVYEEIDLYVFSCGR